MCEASSGCNQTLECLEQNEVKYCGVFLLSDVYWQDAGTPVLQGDDPNRIGGSNCTKKLEILVQNALQTFFVENTYSFKIVF